MKLPVIKPKDLIRKLEKLGFERQRTTGSHVIFKHSQMGTRANVPFHLHEIPRGTLAAIIRESGIRKEDIL